MNSTPQAAATSPRRFTNWAARLAADAALAPAVREGYRVTLLRFLTFCRGRQAEPSVDLARKFVAVARLAEAPGPARLQAWKHALNWFFRRGREGRGSAHDGVPPLARTDLGGPAWERALIAGVRERHLAWRTEETYRGWLGRFARWLAPRRVPEAGTAEVRAFLSKLAVEERCSVATQKQALEIG